MDEATREYIKNLEASLAQANERAELAEAKTERAETRVNALESLQAPSTLLEYVQHAEEELFATFYIEQDPNRQSTAAALTKIEGKHYPLRLRLWADFSSAHETTFGRLKETFGSTAILPSLTDVQGFRRYLSVDAAADGLDIRPFIRACVEKPAAIIVSEYLRLHAHPTIRTIWFKNNAYGLHLPEHDTTSIEGHRILLDLPEAATATTTAAATGAAETAAETAESAGGKGKEDGGGEPPKKKSNSPTKQIGYPDRWGLALRHDGLRAICFVGEHKAAHKFTPGMLQAVLEPPPPESFFSDLLKRKLAEDKAGGQTTASEPGIEGGEPSSAAAAATVTTTQRPPATATRAVAHALCQAFHYMITAGLEFGYIASGEGLVFLRVFEDDPCTLYYYSIVFPVPRLPDEAQRRDANRNVRPPRLTAAAYMCSFCLWALDATVRSAAWIRAATTNVAQWPTPYDQITLPLLARVPYLPPPNEDDDGGGGGGGGGGGSNNGDGGGAPSGNGAGEQRRRAKRTHSQSQASSSVATGAADARTDAAGLQGYVAKICHYVVRRPSLPYCTQGCLLGLHRGLPLDEKCPNVQLHREAAAIATAATAPSGREQEQQVYHTLTVDELRSRLVRQLDDHLEVDCECLDKRGLFGLCGVLFKITLTGYGYTFVAKGVQAAHRQALEQEVAVYEGLAAFQGRLVPVCMGMIDLVYPFPLQSLAKVSHMLLLSWAGPDLICLRPRPPGVDLEEEVWKTNAELEGAGLDNDDVRHDNLTWNAEARRVMQIDFDQARIRWPLKGQKEKQEEPGLQKQPSLVSAAEAASTAPPSPSPPPPSPVPRLLPCLSSSENKRVLDEEGSVVAQDPKRPRLLVNHDQADTL
ncbi:metalloprotease m41 [Niveomyces insectorum RCEF 264]|uniref:Metalloprotease m41 n=1 Tax=Niveomyces insectorum RCEF 264 TaxID=1081102 RepID=A0A167W624_9HYPO|nr:metalloprotease m41 [Niveomyces insectorum RCEF 264]